MDGYAKTAEYDDVANRVSHPNDGECEQDHTYRTLLRHTWKQRFWKKLRTKLITDC
jgi:hypothetical protein